MASGFILLGFQNATFTSCTHRDCTVFKESDQTHISEKRAMKIHKGVVWVTFGFGK